MVNESIADVLHKAYGLDKSSDDFFLFSLCTLNQTHTQKYVWNHITNHCFVIINHSILHTRGEGI